MNDLPVGGSSPQSLRSPPLTRAFADVVREARLRKLWSQYDLAHAMGVKSNSTVAMWETGKGIPRLDVALRLANLLEIKLENLKFEAIKRPERRRLGVAEERCFRRDPSDKDYSVKCLRERQ